MKQLIFFITLLVCNSACTMEQNLSEKDKEDILKAGEIVNQINAIRLMREDCLYRFPDMKNEIKSNYDNSKIREFAELTPVAVPQENDELSRSFIGMKRPKPSGESLERCKEGFQKSLVVFDENSEQYRIQISRYLREVKPKVEKMMEN